eukprot:1761083-Rhodomonas_salina.5
MMTHLPTHKTRKDRKRDSTTRRIPGTDQRHQERADRPVLAVHLNRTAPDSQSLHTRHTVSRGPSPFPSLRPRPSPPCPCSPPSLPANGGCCSLFRPLDLALCSISPSSPPSACDPAPAVSSSSDPGSMLPFAARACTAWSRPLRRARPVPTHTKVSPHHASNRAMQRTFSSTPSGAMHTTCSDSSSTTRNSQLGALGPASFGLDLSPAGPEQCQRRTQHGLWK